MRCLATAIDEIEPGVRVCALASVSHPEHAAADEVISCSASRFSAPPANQYYTNSDDVYFGAGEVSRLNHRPPGRPPRHGNQIQVEVERGRPFALAMLGRVVRALPFRQNMQARPPQTSSGQSVRFVLTPVDTCSTVRSFVVVYH